VRWVLLLLVALAVAAAGCSVDDDSAATADTSALTAAELGWIRSYSAWTIAIYNDEARAGPRLVRECRERHEELGPTPTDRLRPAADLAVGICPFLAEEGTRRRALDTIDAADDLLRPLLRDEQPLELRAGVTDGSRADTAFSAFATETVERPVEVRCWSTREWRRVVDEENAWTNSSDDAEELYGWADDGSDRIQMRLDQCNTISRLRDKGARARPQADRLEAANSLGTLAHEVQHLVLPDAGEARVECAGMRSLPSVAERLGLDRASAVALAELYRTEIYPDQPKEYIAGGCPRQP
jgi:hypothetical protein